MNLWPVIAATSWARAMNAEEETAKLVRAQHGDVLPERPNNVVPLRPVQPVTPTPAKPPSLFAFGVRAFLWFAFVFWLIGMVR